MKVLYFDCFSGISGDMCLGALVSLGVDFDFIVNELKKLKLEGYHLEQETVMKCGISANYIKVVLDKHDHCHRHLSDIEIIIDSSELNPSVKKLSKKIFTLLAEAEAKVHNTTIDKIHFHEVGAVDSIVDIVGTAICIDYLSPDKIYSSTINDGFGFVNCAHGKMPIPVPATSEIFSLKNITWCQIDVENELVTPTGAAIIGTLAESFGLMPSMQITKTGYGAGTRDLKIPNVLRVSLGATNENTDLISVLETNIDDTTPEILGYVMERLLEAGALDVFFTNIYMKKNRPAVKLTVLCDNESVSQMEKIIFTETTTLGIRKRQESRYILERTSKTIKINSFDVKVKSFVFENKETTMPEFESAKLFAKSSGIPLREAYDFIIRNV